MTQTVDQEPSAELINAGIEQAQAAFGSPAEVVQFGVSKNLDELSETVQTPEESNSSSSKARQPGQLMSEAELAQAAGLVARFYSRINKAWRYTPEVRFEIQLALLRLGVKLDHPLATPDPRAPQGGSSIAIRQVA